MEIDFHAAPESVQKLGLTCLALLGPAGIDRDARDYHTAFVHFARCAGMTQQETVAAMRWMARQWADLLAGKIADGSIKSASIVDRISIEQSAERLHRLADHLEATPWDAP